MVLTEGTCRVAIKNPLIVSYSTIFNEKNQRETSKSFKKVSDTRNG